MSVQTERVWFQGAFDDRLAGHLDRPAVAPEAYAIFAHCFTCSKDLKATRRISRTLADRGIAVLRFDFTGLGESEGDFTGTNFSSNIDDLVAAAEFLRNRYEAPRLLVGHSLGGTAALVAASRMPEIEAVATIASPAGTGHLRDLLVKKAPHVETEGEAEVELGGRRFRIKKQLLDDLNEQSVRDAVQNLNRALLLFHSPADKIVDIEQARLIYEAARHPKSFISLDRADHLLLSDERDAGFAGDVLACWSARYLTKAAAGPERSELQQGQVLAEAAASGYATKIAAGPHRFLSDEPEEHGGSDTGPNPYELLLAGLGACTSMTLRMYADRKEWPLGGIRVRLSHSRIHARDCADCETQEGKVDRIERRIQLGGELSDEQRQRLLEIADRCPVSRTLTSETRILSELE